MSETRPRYRFFRINNKWVVSEVSYTDNGWYGTHRIADFMDREEARKKTYEMNGWNYKS